MRTCDAIGAKLILVGYTPRPTGTSLKLIKKTAIGSEQTVKWHHFEHWQNVFESYPASLHIGIEISERSRSIFEFLKTEDRRLKTEESADMMLWFGNEIHGLEEKLCERLDYELHLPMLGMKESLNVASTVCAVGYLFLGKILGYTQD